ncbi:MAG: hypothetical protein ACREL7_01160 [Longimicrobiales bacterium]
MSSRMMAGAAALMVIAACSTAQLESANEVSTPPAGAAGEIVPVGTEFSAELDQTISAKDNDAGDAFTATVTEDIRGDADVIVPAGSKVTGRITGIDESEKIGDQAAIRVVFESINVNGTEHALSADVTNVDVSVTDRANVEDLQKKAGVGAAAGAVVGAIVGGQLKDILVGGALGAGAGTIISLGTGDVQSALPEGSELNLRVTERVAMR